MARNKCGAQTRKGTPCKRRPLPFLQRCAWHTILNHPVVNIGIALAACAFSIFAYIFPLSDPAANEFDRTQIRQFIDDTISKELEAVPKALDNLSQVVERATHAGTEFAVGVAGAIERTHSDAENFRHNIEELLWTFESMLPAEHRHPADDLRIRLGLATAALFDGRYSDVFELVSEKDVSIGRTPQEQGDFEVRTTQLLGQAWFGLRRWKKAKDAYQRVLQLRSNNMVARIYLAGCFDALGKLPQAIEHYNVVRRHYDHLVKTKPTPEFQNQFARVLSNLGIAFWKQDKYDKAICILTQAVQVYTELTEDQKRVEFAENLAKSLNNLGIVLLDQGQPINAARKHDKALRIRRTLAATNRHPDVQNDLAMSLNNRGVARRMQGHAQDAIGDFNEAINIRAGLLVAGHIQFANDLARSLTNLGNGFLDVGKLHKAKEAVTKSIEILSALVEQPEILSRVLAEILSALGFEIYANLTASLPFKDNTTITAPQRRAELANQLALALENRCIVRVRLGELNHAIADCNRSVKIFETLVSIHKLRQFEDDLAEALNSLGIAHMFQQLFPAAEEEFTQCITINRRLIEEGRTDLAHSLAAALTNRSYVALRQRKFMRAANDLRDAAKAEFGPKRSP